MPDGHERTPAARGSSAALITRRQLLAGLGAIAAYGAVPRAMAADRPRIGVYSDFFSLPSAHTARENEAAARRLHAVGINHYHLVELGRDMGANRDFLLMLRSYGIQTGIRAQTWGDVSWRDGTAGKVLKEYAVLDGLAFDLYLGHEVLEWANKKERAQMVALADRYFTRTLTRMYIDRFSIVTQHLGLRHPAGGLWDDYRVPGPREPDILHFALSPIGKPEAAIEKSYNNNANYLSREVPNRPFRYTHAALQEKSILGPAGQARLKTAVEFLRRRQADVFILRFVNKKGEKIRASGAALNAIGSVLAVQGRTLTGPARRV